MATSNVVYVAVDGVPPPPPDWQQWLRENWMVVAFVSVAAVVAVAIAKS